PGTSLAPDGPTPFFKPNVAPDLVTHWGPSGPSATYGIRSRICREASDVNNSGGIHGMSRWQSAEIRLYCIGSLLRCCKLLGPSLRPGPRGGQEVAPASGTGYPDQEWTKHSPRP